MEVSVSQFRAQLKDYLAKAKDGQDVVITDRGVPVARLTGVEGANLLEQLEREGLVTAPDQTRPAAPAVGPERGADSALSGLLKRLRR
ncbi:MAG: type II toxin-antitoxin system prevent-host-death family antitoxin [Micrococcales bacterium]|nr:type II toxin-antitoxin system prevent-host-death family antitoxin [Micrococcales bacterium]